MINKQAVREAMLRRVRPFDDARDLADVVARELYLHDEMPEVQQVAEEVCREVCEQRDGKGVRLPDRVLPEEVPETERNVWTRHDDVLAH
jgi:hypothetical protein